jgi:hypothetical protein
LDQDLETVLSVKELISLTLSVYRESGISVSRVFCCAKQLYEKKATVKFKKKWAICLILTERHLLIGGATFIPIVNNDG